jgi:dinuclear metal center YbgI/SA1388 family protein
MRIGEVTTYLESLVPLSSQESYDNCGLLVGDKNNEVKAVLLCLDCTEEVVLEAERLGVNLIIAHHPIIFTGLKSLTGKNYVERTVLSCVKKNIALYAIHTNLDNYRFGVNHEIGQRLGLKNLRILSGKENALYKLVVFVPQTHHQALNQALFEAGAGEIGNYDQCHFSMAGEGTFRPLDHSNPYSGKRNELSVENEIRAEYLVSSHNLSKVLSSMKAVHPYEEIAHDIYPLKNENPFEGSGMVGELTTEMTEADFLKKVKKEFSCKVIRHTQFLNNPVRKVAFCGGSGSFLLKHAIASEADVFLTSDFKYHEFFDAENRIVIADIGHYESEQFTPNLLETLLKKKFTTFAIHLTEINTNPINYL